MNEILIFLSASWLAIALPFVILLMRDINKQHWGNTLIDLKPKLNK